MCPKYFAVRTFPNLLLFYTRSEICDFMTVVITIVDKSCAVCSFLLLKRRLYIRHILSEDSKQKAISKFNIGCSIFNRVHIS